MNGLQVMLYILQHMKSLTSQYVYR